MTSEMSKVGFSLQTATYSAHKIYSGVIYSSHTFLDTEKLRMGILSSEASKKRQRGKEKSKSWFKSRHRPLVEIYDLE